MGNSVYNSQRDTYLSFKIGEEVFAACSNQVINIIELCNVTQIPNTSKLLKGVINYRGKGVPLINSKELLKIEEIGTTRNTCILIVQATINCESTLIGILVDSVLEVLEINATQIFPLPKIGFTSINGFILGLVLFDEKFIIVVDFNKTLSDEEFNFIKLDSNVNESQAS